MSFSQSELPDERSTPESRDVIRSFSAPEASISAVMASGLPSRAYKKPMYALHPELDCVAEVMQNFSWPASIAASRSLTETSRPTKPSFSARLCRMPNTTGVMEMDCACFTR